MTRASHVTLVGMGLPQAAPPLLMSLVVVLVLLPPRVTPTAYSDRCPCATPTPHHVLLEEQLSDTTTRTRELNCCPRQLLAAHDPRYHPSDSFSLVWSFKGKEYKVVDGVEHKWASGVSTFRIAYCGLQTLESSYLRVFDEGVYSCHVTSSSVASVTKTFSLCLNVNEDLGSPPLNSSISENTLALLRQTVTFNCSAYVGNPRCGRTRDYRLVWTKERRDGSWVEASKLSHTEIITSAVKKGVMKSRLTVHSVQTDHWGRFRCTVTNHNGNLTLDVTLKKGVPPVIRVTGEYRAALVILVGATVFLGAAVLLWRRCQVAFTLHFREKSAGSSTEEHQYDVFLVHGDSATRWVWSILLPALEDFGYTCFLPQRDMCGGSMIIEEVAETVCDCRCVLVVITPCLLENPWAAWALHNAVKAALNTRTRILALLLQDLDHVKAPPDTSGIGGVLKHIRKIPVPRSCRWEDYKAKEDPLLNSPSEEETLVRDAHNSLKGLKVDTTVCRSRSRSPKNQKLSNMITGGKMTSGDAAEYKKEYKFRGPVIFVEKEDSEDPCSSYSQTPFISPSAAAVQKDGSSLVRVKKKASLCTFLRVLCAGDTQELFWHTLLGWLGPPGTTIPKRLKGDTSKTTCSA